MKHIEDELFNRYLDNDLEINELTLIKDHLNNCDLCLSKLKALRVVDSQLKKLEVSHVRNEFTENMMKKINKAAAVAAPKEFYFFRFIYSLLIIIMLAVIVFFMIDVSGSIKESSGSVDYIKAGTSLLISSVKPFVGNIDISVLGTVISFIFFISMYLIYDSHKRIKSRLDKL